MEEKTGNRNEAKRGERKAYKFSRKSSKTKLGIACHSLNTSQR